MPDNPPQLLSPSLSQETDRLSSAMKGRDFSLGVVRCGGKYTVCFPGLFLSVIIAIKCVYLINIADSLEVASSQGWSAPARLTNSLLFD